MNDLFYVFGIALAALALVVSFFGMRSEKFPGSRGPLLGGLALFGVLVVGACAFAVSLSADEQKIHAAEYAEFRAEQADAEAAASTAGDQSASSSDPSENPEPEKIEPAKSATLDLMSPADGSLAFQPDALEADAGEISIDFTNPSEVPHNVAIEVDGETVAQSATVTTGDDAVATADLEPGEYTFYCSIPGHRQSGMEGTLTVK